MVAVDRYPGCIRFVQQTAQSFGLTQVRTVKADVFKFLKQPPARAFDVIFADPPFDMEERSLLTELVLKNGWLKPGGWFVLEHPSSEDAEYDLPGIENRRYGNCSFAFFQHAHSSAT